MALHAAPNNFRTFEILVAAQYGGADVKVNYAQRVSDSTKFPFGKLPCYENAQGKSFTGSHAIAKLLAGASLTPKSCDKSFDAQLVQWFELVDNDLVPNSLAWLLPAVSAIRLNQSQFDEAKTETLRLLSVLNNYLVSRTFLIGERLSLADVAVSCALLPLFQHLLEAEDRKTLVNLTRWFETCVNQPKFRVVLGQVHLCTKASQFDGQKLNDFERQQPPKTQDKPKQEKAKKDKEKKEQPATKCKEKKEKGKEDEAEAPDAAEEALAQEPKQNDPFADLPKGKLNLEEFKRVYSNEDTSTKALPYFWQNFDPEAYSIWYSEYKYPDQLTLAFMSCNLISGMYQRLDKLRKNAFASVCLFGTDNNSTISGIWVWRGHDLVFDLCDDWKIDYESYDWKKLDPKQEQTKAMVNEYFAWEGAFGGKKFNQGKIFK